MATSPPLASSRRRFPAFYPEIGPYLMGRAITQFNGYMPDEGPDAWVAPIHIGEIASAFLPVNTPVEDGEEMTVLGVRMQFFTKYGSEATRSSRARSISLPCVACVLGDSPSVYGWPARRDSNPRPAA